MKNIDVIRQMTAKELAEFFRDVQDNENYFCGAIKCDERLCSYNRCYEYILAWLEQESEE